MSRSIRRRASAATPSARRRDRRACAMSCARARRSAATGSVPGQRPPRSSAASVPVVKLARSWPSDASSSDVSLVISAMQLVDLGADRPRRQLVAIRRELRDQAGRELVVDRVAQRLELGVGRWMRTAMLRTFSIWPSRRARSSAAAARRRAGSRGVVEVRRSQVALEEPAARRASRTRTPERPPKARSLGQLVGRVGVDEVLLEDVAAHEVVVIGERSHR